MSIYVMIGLIWIGILIGFAGMRYWFTRKPAEEGKYEK